ncbi:MAG: hypothetical protein J2P25_18115 [Nocardiopsaceae bacterium]|nr:hypothetical protein [Nocardiopsaceae bacterium]
MTARGPARSQRSGWPAVRTPRWMLAGAGVLVAGMVIAAIPHHPSASQRVSDLRGFVSAVNTDIESCAGGITDSRTALREIEAGASHDVATAVTIANDAAANCSPANSMPLDDLVQYQVAESLASFHLQATVNELVTWAFPLAQRVEADIGKLAAASAQPARASTRSATTRSARKRASSRLRADQRALDAQRATIDKAIAAANKALGSHVAPPRLPA